MAEKDDGKKQAPWTERAKNYLRDKADSTPLFLLYILNGFFILYWMVDLIPGIIMPGGDPLPVIDEVFKTIALYYYNSYLLKRTFGVLNPVRIMKREDPYSKKRAGILPYEKNMNIIRKKLKDLRKEVKKSDIPGMDESKVDKLQKRIKEIDDRLHKIDRLISKGGFQADQVRTEIARIEGLVENAEDESLREELEKSLSHAQGNLENIERILEERNRLVTRLDRFRIQVDDSYSRIMAMSISAADMESTGRLFDELFSAVDNFDSTLQEIERRPAPSPARQTVEELEKSIETKSPSTQRQNTKT